MARKPKVLRCVVNPFAHLDHDGRPACAVQHEPRPNAQGTELLRFHGATLQATVIEARAATKIIYGAPGTKSRVIAGDPRPSLHDRTFTFAYGEVLTVPDTKYYRGLLTPGLGHRPLLPADKETSDKLGLPHRAPELVIVDTADVEAKAWSDANPGENPEWVEVDAKLLDGAPELADVHPVHIAAARYLAKIRPMKDAENAKHRAASDEFRGNLELKQRAAAEAAETKALADAKATQERLATMRAQNAKPAAAGEPIEVKAPAPSVVVPEEPPHAQSVLEPEQPKPGK
jgi:hypothetical protein